MSSFYLFLCKLVLNSYYKYLFTLLFSLLTSFLLNYYFPRPPPITLCYIEQSNSCHQPYPPNQLPSRLKCYFLLMWHSLHRPRYAITQTKAQTGLALKQAFRPTMRANTRSGTTYIVQKHNCPASALKIQVFQFIG